MEILDVNSVMHDQLIFCKGAKKRYWKRTVSSINSAVKLRYSYGERPVFLPILKNQFKMAQCFLLLTIKQLDKKRDHASRYWNRNDLLKLDLKNTGTNQD